jgi:hypothetical protein
MVATGAVIATAMMLTEKIHALLVTELLPSAPPKCELARRVTAALER